MCSTRLRQLWRIDLSLPSVRQVWVMILVWCVTANLSLANEELMRKTYPEVVEIRRLTDSDKRQIPNIIATHKDGSVWEYIFWPMRRLNGTHGKQFFTRRILFAKPHQLPTEEVT